MTRVPTGVTEGTKVESKLTQGEHIKSIEDGRVSDTSKVNIDQWSLPPEVEKKKSGK